MVLTNSAASFSLQRKLRHSATFFASGCMHVGHAPRLVHIHVTSLLHAAKKMRALVKQVFSKPAACSLEYS